MGRLFDAVSALIGVRQVVAYEAQAAIELEGLARGMNCGETSYTFDVDRSDQTTLIDPAPVVQAVVRDHRDGVAAGVIGARFHRAVADLIVGLADQERDASRTVALSGGVFQNCLLLQLTLKGLQVKGLQVITHRAVPPNDGGVALGQLMVGNSG
jgi:hydrogenase maturation protein HypF